MPAPQVLTIDEPARRLRVWADSYVPFDEPDVDALLAAADFTNALTPIKTITFKRRGETDEFDYEIELDGGRKWTQTIQFDPYTTTDPPMTFEVQDQWKLSEFERQRPIRDLMLHFKTAHNAERVELDYDDYSIPE